MAIVYPDALPGPAPATASPRPRRAESSLDGPVQARARQRDVAGAQRQLSWVYTADEMAIWREWYDTTLSSGRFWFIAYLPGVGGLDRPKLVRYLTVSEALLGGGLYRVTATLELRANLPESVFFTSLLYPVVVEDRMALSTPAPADHGNYLIGAGDDDLAFSIPAISGGSLFMSLSAAGYKNWRDVNPDEMTFSTPAVTGGSLAVTIAYASYPNWRDINPDEMTFSTPAITGGSLTVTIQYVNYLNQRDVIPDEMNMFTPTIQSGSLT